MKKILLVGFASPYDYPKKLGEQYPNTIFIQEDAILYSGSRAVIELAGMVDGVMFMSVNNSERLMWEVACVMKNVRIVDASEYPIDEEKAVENNESV